MRRINIITPPKIVPPKKEIIIRRVFLDGFLCFVNTLFITNFLITVFILKPSSEMTIPWILHSCIHFSQFILIIQQSSRTPITTIHPPKSLIHLSGIDLSLIQFLLNQIRITTTIIRSRGIVDSSGSGVTPKIKISRNVIDRDILYSLINLNYSRLRIIRRLRSTPDQGDRREKKNYFFHVISLEYFFCFVNLFLLVLSKNNINCIVVNEKIFATTQD